MAKKRGMKKSSMMKKDMMMNKSCGTCMCNCKIVWTKLTAMAFILFLITVWPALMTLVHKIHWGWFLGATVIFGAFAWKHNCCCKK